jgi:predicted DNA-binding WGR domain protein
MAKKLGRSEFPSGHSRDDFECFGPVATKDTDFVGCRLADFGCFKQDEGTDSNKFYHAAVVKSKKDGRYYLYVEYGRTKDGVPSSPQYQFTSCSDVAEAEQEFVKQCAEKNTKRGIWEKVGSKERYVPKPKKDGTTEDLYVVRYMLSRAVGLAAAKNICNKDSLPVAAPTEKKSTKTAKKKIDLPTRKLLKDLLGGTVSYTRSVMVGNAMPALSAISDARDLLDDALVRVKKVGDKVENQVADATLKKLTYALYGMIPKAKAAGAAEATWILSQDNIGHWKDDLDAFENALKSANVEEVNDDNDDIMQGIPANIESIDMKSELGMWLNNWWVNSTRNKHGHRTLQIHNLWKIERHGDFDTFKKNVEVISGEMPEKWNNERPMFYENQKQRPDLTASERKLFHNSNSALLFHGTRAVNVAGIIRENLRFPKQLVGVVTNGAMMGEGVYSADDWGKSAGYCSVGSGRSMYAGSNGHVSGRRSFMFGVDVALGNPHVAPGAYGYTDAPKGHHCVLGKHNHTTAWGGRLQNNEWIIYKKGRIILRYLAELSWY